MKRVFLFTALILALVASVAMAAGAAAPAKKGGLDIWVGAGYAKMLESGGPKGNLGALVGVNYMMTPTIAVGVEAGYLIAGKTDSSYTVGGTEYKFSAKSTIMPITGQVTYYMSAGGFKPYFGGGAGFYMMKSKVTIDPAIEGFTDIDGSETKFGFNAGAGFEVPAGSSMAVGVDAKVHFVSGASSDEQGNSKMGKILTLMGTVHFK